MTTGTPTPEKKSFSDLMRVWFKGIFTPIAILLNRLGIHPNIVTLFGLVGHGVAAFFVATGHLTIGGILVLVMGPVDFLDGTMARLRGKFSQFGAFVDSVVDRYSELIILGGLLYYFTQQENWIGCGLVYLAAVGSVLVSYVRAKAEALGFNAKMGILTRLERYFILVPALIFNIPMIGLAIIALLANFTALQRIFNVRHQYYFGNNSITEEKMSPPSA